MVFFNEIHSSDGIYRTREVKKERIFIHLRLLDQDFLHLLLPRLLFLPLQLQQQQQPLFVASSTRSLPSSFVSALDNLKKNVRRSPSSPWEHDQAVPFNASCKGSTNISN